MILGYNTNGLAHHHPEDALRVLAEIGYRAVALTIDHGTLNPRDPHAGAQAGRLRRLARKLGLTLVIETGGRFLLDPWIKHEPTLVSADAGRRATRSAFYVQAIDAAREVGAVCVSIWSGVFRDDVSRDAAWERLVNGMGPVLDHARRAGVPVAFEPEPGMLVGTLDDFDELVERLRLAGAAIDALRLTLDVGHLQAQGETPLGERIERHAERLANVHLEDAHAGIHEHLPFGDGAIDFTPVIESLGRIAFAGPVCVELSRHSHEGPDAARRAYDFLAPRWPAGAASPALPRPSDAG